MFNIWVKNNKLELNWSKSKIITFGADSLSLNNLTNIKINNTIIDEVSHYKLVGITIDRKLTWKNHISGLCNSLKYINYLLNRIKNYTPKKTMLLIYNSLFQSKLSFGISIWGGIYKGQMKQLEILQKKAIRAVYNKKANSHTLPLFKEGEVMPLDDLITYHSALLAKSIRINPPKNTSSLIQEIPLPPGPTTRLQLEPEKVIVPNHKTYKLSKQCCVKIPETWNRLPFETKFSSNNTFKTHLKKYLFQQHNYE